jgi:hypothetical protein
MPRVVYSRHYNIGFYGLERLHPFDSRKYGRSWKLLRRHFGSMLRSFQVCPERPANHDELSLVHTANYFTHFVIRTTSLEHWRFLRFDTFPAGRSTDTFFAPCVGQHAERYSRRSKLSNTVSP